MTRKKKPSELKDLKPNPDIEESQQEEVRGGFIATEHGALDAEAVRARARAERSGPARG